MRRMLWMIVTLVLIGGWLIVSYVPGAQTVMPDLGWPEWSLLWLRGLAIGSAALFLVLQVWIVIATDRALTREAATARQFRLRRGPEAVWTALPALSTLILIAAIVLAAQPG